MLNSKVERPQELRELTLRDLRRVKIEGDRTDGYALLGLALDIHNRKAQKEILCGCLQKCPEMNRHWSQCNFGRVALSPALTAEGAYLLMSVLGDELTLITANCLAVGTRILRDADAARELFERVCVAAKDKPKPWGR